MTVVGAECDGMDDWEEEGGGAEWKESPDTRMKGTEL